MTTDVEPGPGRLRPFSLSGEQALLERFGRAVGLSTRLEVNPQVGCRGGSLALAPHVQILVLDDGMVAWENRLVRGVRGGSRP